MLPGGTRVVRVIYRRMLPGLDLQCADPARPPTTGGEELDDL